MLAGGLPVLRVLPEEEERAKEILARYSDKDWSLCGALYFAVISIAAELARRSPSITISVSSAVAKVWGL